jgi:hypothetical protein
MEVMSETGRPETKTTCTITFDGACAQRNPGGAMGLGWTVDGKPGRAFLDEDPSNTNNVAEYLALCRGGRTTIACCPIGKNRGQPAGRVEARKMLPKGILAEKSIRR